MWHASVGSSLSFIADVAYLVSSDWIAYVEF